MLLVDNELHLETLSRRIDKVTGSTGVVSDTLYFLPMRGKDCALEQVANDIIEAARGMGYTGNSASTRGRSSFVRRSPSQSLPAATKGKRSKIREHGRKLSPCFTAKRTSMVRVRHMVPG